VHSLEHHDLLSIVLPLYPSFYMLPLIIILK
jgi:hypothetical protein